MPFSLLLISRKSNADACSPEKSVAAYVFNWLYKTGLWSLGKDVASLHMASTFCMLRQQYTDYLLLGQL